MSSNRGGLIAAIVGSVVGLVFGLLVLLSGTGSAFAVLGVGAVGAFVAWLVYGTATGTLDFRGAFRALRRR